MNVPAYYEIGGIVVSIVVGIVTYWKAQEHKELLAVAVTTLGAILSLLIGIRYSVAPSIEKHVALQQKMAATPHATDILEKYSNTFEYLTKNNDSDSLIVQEFEYQRYVQIGVLDSFGKGEFTITSDQMPSFALRMIRSAKKKFTATSYVDSSDWWKTPWGKKYRNENKIAVEKGVEIQRTYVVQSEEEFNLLRPIMDEQVDQKIDVQFAMTKDVGLVASDLVIIDENIAGTLTLTPEKKMKSAVFQTDKREIEDVRRKIDKIRVQAEKYEKGMEFPK